MLQVRHIINRILGKDAMKYTERSFMAFLLSLCIFLSLVLNVAYVGAHSAHQCHDKDCSVCETLHASYERIKEIGSSLILLSISIFLALTFISQHLYSTESNEVEKTLVRLKVRMDN